MTSLVGLGLIGAGLLLRYLWKRGSEAKRAALASRAAYLARVRNVADYLECVRDERER